jgi:hypothetical protein
MKKIIILFIFTSALLIPGIRDCFGQTITFQKTFGGLEAEYLNSVVQTPDNGYIAVGSKRISPNEYIYIVRFNAFGDTLWTKIIPGDDAMCVIKTIDGHYALCDINGRILKFDINGNILFLSTYYDLQARVVKLVQNVNGDYFLCGGNFSPSYRPYLLNLNQNGVYLWDSIYSAGFYNGNFADLKISNNKIVLTGSYSQASPLTQNIFIMMLSFNGERLFFNSGYNELYIHPNGLIETLSGSYVIGGSFRSNNPFIAKYSNQGEFKWIRTYDTAYRESAKSVTLDTEGNIVYAGYFDSLSAPDLVRIRKVDTNGVELWKKNYGIKGQHQVGLDIKLTSDSGFVVSGVTSTFSQGDVYLLKTDKNGDLLPPIGIQPINNELPLAFELYQNYPNPFNPSTEIRFDLPTSGEVMLSIHDILGRLIEMPVDKYLTAGQYRINWNPLNLSSGVYFYSISFGKSMISRKMLFLK